MTKFIETKTTYEIKNTYYILHPNMIFTTEISFILNYENSVRQSALLQKLNPIIKGGGDFLNLR